MNFQNAKKHRIETSQKELVDLRDELASEIIFKIQAKTRAIECMSFTDESPDKGEESYLQTLEELTRAPSRQPSQAEGPKLHTKICGAYFQADRCTNYLFPQADSEMTIDNHLCGVGYTPDMELYFVFKNCPQPHVRTQTPRELFKEQVTDSQIQAIRVKYINKL